MSNIQTGAERMPHDLSHLGFLAGQIGRLITISTTPVIAGDSFEMDAVGALRLTLLRRGLAINSTLVIFFFQAEDGIRDYKVTGVQTCALPICCGQHHVADLGFYGVSRKMSGYAVPHFQVILGGQWDHNAASYGLPVVAVPSKNIPERSEERRVGKEGRPRWTRDREGETLYAE